MRPFALHHRVRNDLHELSPVRDTGCVRAKPGVGRELGAVEDLGCEEVELGRLLGCHSETGVFRLKETCTAYLSVVTCTNHKKTVFAREYLVWYYRGVGGSMSAGFLTRYEVV